VAAAGAKAQAAGVVVAVQRGHSSSAHMDPNRCGSALCIHSLAACSGRIEICRPGFVGHNNIRTTMPILGLQ
jgi:hypothetical protein